MRERSLMLGYDNRIWNVRNQLSICFICFHPFKVLYAQWTILPMMYNRRHWHSFGLVFYSLEMQILLTFSLVIPFIVLSTDFKMQFYFQRIISCYLEKDPPPPKVDDWDFKPCTSAKQAKNMWEQQCLILGMWIQCYTSGAVTCTETIYIQ
jgi:hypothetical protein